MITSIDQPFFQYRGDNGKMVTEWNWWDALREEYGLKVKYIKATVQKALEQNLMYQTSGKQVDVMPTHRAYFPQWLNLSQGLNKYINEKYMGNSPGIDNVILTESKWDGTYRCISPIGAVDAIWYNETMVDQLGLKDPHKTWKEGKWDWNAWKNFLTSVPTQNPSGQVLSRWSQAEHDSIVFWPQTAGVTLFDIDRTSKEPKLINNFNDPKVAKSLVFYAETSKGTAVANAALRNHERWEDFFTKGIIIMMNTQYLTMDFSNSEYAKNSKFNWVPYPRSPEEGGVNVAMSYGATMMLPRKMKVAKNAPYAMKIMELWANRFTEAYFDFQKSGHLQFNYAQRKEYYEFTSQNNYFGIGYRVLEALTGDELEYYKQLYWSMYNNNWDTATAIEQLRNLAAKACEEVV